MPTAIKTGLITFALLSYLILVGIPGRTGGNALPLLALLAALLFWYRLRRTSQAISERVPLAGTAGQPKPGWEVGHGPQAQVQARAETRGGLSSLVLAQGAAAGATTGLLIATVSAVFAAILGNGVAIQPVFDKIVPVNVAALLGVSPGAVAEAQVPPLRYLFSVLYFTGGGVLAALAVLAGKADAAQAAGSALLKARLSGPAFASALHWLVIAFPFALLAVVVWLGLPGVGAFGTDRSTVRLLFTLVATGSGLFALRAANPGRERLIVSVLLGIGVLIMPFVLDQFQNSVMGIVFIFVMMGLGLNIVVGYAGLLDLGYVAFFAIGAYVYAFVSAPFSSPFISGLLTGLGVQADSPLLGYWMALPLAMITAAIGGILLGIPVLRLRGDYLAIVTLGFGEIIRLFMLNLGELTNGPRGILEIAQPGLFGLEPEAVSGGLLSSQGWIFLLALASSASIAFVAVRLNDSRLGRAWIAMQEDEDVAQATGVHLVRTKLLAFAIGATFAGLAGQLYAARQINIFPENFSLFVSIDALALIIVGGIGSPAGIVLGALALKGLPEVLRGVDEYRIVAFAALLVIMMIVRPAGILPSSRRRFEAAAEDAGESQIGPEANGEIVQELPDDDGAAAAGQDGAMQ